MKKRRRKQPSNEQGFKPEVNPAPRRYRLTLEGLERLRQSARKTQPWKKARGPSTLQGKAKSSQNAVKHGKRRTQTIAQTRYLRALLRVVHTIPEMQFASLGLWQLLRDYNWTAWEDLRVPCPHGFVEQLIHRYTAMEQVRLRLKRAVSVALEWGDFQEEEQEILWQVLEDRPAG